MCENREDERGSPGCEGEGGGGDRGIEIGNKNTVGSLRHLYEIYRKASEKAVHRDAAKREGGQKKGRRERDGEGR